MPEIVADESLEIKEKPLVANAQEQEFIGDLFELISEEKNQWRDDYTKNILVECYNFKERRQWLSADMQLLSLSGTPALPVDRIGRTLDTVEGIRTNTDNHKKVVKTETGDEGIANLMDKVSEKVGYIADFDTTRSEAFGAMLDCGIGIRKLGFDPLSSNGEGEIWCDVVNVEEFWSSPCKKKTLEDIKWSCEHTVVDWESAMIINPEKASEVKGLRMMASPEWEKLKGGVTGTINTRDYQNNGAVVDKKYQFPDSVHLWEFWIQKVTPFKKVSGVSQVPIQMEVPDDFGNPVPQTVDVPQPYINEVHFNEPLKEGEEALSYYTKTTWDQYIVASTEDKKNSLMLKTGEAKEHPYIGMCAEKKKSGAYVGLVEKIIPHQKRINIAWSQKIAYNNKSIKSPLVIETQGDFDVEGATKQSHFGSILQLKSGEKIVSLNLQPQNNIQAIEEGNMARADMDFAAAATEGVLTGSAQGTNSGIQLSQQQSAAITPLNKWVKAERESELLFWRKVLKLIVANFQPLKYARIVGAEDFSRWTGLMVTPDGQLQPHPMAGQPDPSGSVPIPMPIRFPLDINMVEYDVVIQDQSLSDFNKQQQFNAMMTLRGSNIPLEDSVIIKSAPIKNTQEVLDSNQRARMDIIQAQQQQIAMLEEQLNMAQKLIPREEKVAQARGDKKPQTSNQHGSAEAGRNASQAGKRSMLGGQTK